MWPLGHVSETELFSDMNNASKMIFSMRLFRFSKEKVDCNDLKALMHLLGQILMI
jgi:hypothetical protein